MLLLAQSLPVPRDLELPLPLPEWILAVLLVLSFLLHILFVNLTVGSSILTMIYEFLGWRQNEPKFDLLAHRITETITVDKSVAVVLGIGPLLCINLLYTVQFYTANTLTGHAWILIVPMVIAAFLLAYLHKYSWDRWSRSRWKIAHLCVGFTSMLLFLLIPFIFLSNVNLMLFPEKWAEVRGFFSSLMVGNVFPRYFHFLCASLAISGLFFAGWFGRKSFPLAKLAGFTHPELRRIGYKIAFRVTAAQFFFGPLLLLTLPKAGLSTSLYTVILAGAGLGLVVLLMLHREIAAPDERIGRAYVPICVTFTVIVLAMGTGRHLYRETALALHKELVRQRTANYAVHLKEFNEKLASGLIAMPVTGERVFQNCASCHAKDTVLAGPSLIEIAAIYKGNPEGIVRWATAPGKKRAGFQQMPSFAILGPEKLQMVAEYMLEVGAKDSPAK